MVYVFEDTLSVVSQKPTLMKRSSSMENLKNICPPKSSDVVMDVSMDLSVSMDVAMANMNISQISSVATPGKGSNSVLKRSPPMKRTNWYQNQGPRKLQKESRVYMRAN